ncbi:MAG TPA: type II secretion system F family protein [Stellaceae bacterium]|nr:type II secretion system F family protein [Stellaceae bacterium]
MRFRYQALQRDGRLVSGLIEAPSLRGAHRDLRRRGVRPTAIEPAAPAAKSRARRRRLGRRDYATALKQLHALVAGGVPLAEAVTGLGEASGHPGLAAAYGELTAGLRRGEPLPRAFARAFPEIAPHIHRMIEAGDFSGRLAEALADAAAELEREARTRTELRHTLLYPAFLVCFGVLAIVFIFLVVVPRFAVMFAGRFDKLPLLSAIVIGAGMWFRAHLAPVLALVAGAAAAAMWAWSRPAVRAGLLDAAMRLPLLRRWSGEVEIARWAAVLARLLENRVPLIHSLELARTALRRRDLQLRLGRVERDVRAGAALAVALADSAVLSPTALSLIRVGERAGNLPEMVRGLATLCDEAVRDRSRTILAIVEPAAILVLGTVIGVVAMAIFLAITSVNNVPGL